MTNLFENLESGATVEGYLEWSTGPKSGRAGLY